MYRITDVGLKLHCPNRRCIREYVCGYNVTNTLISTRCIVCPIHAHRYIFPYRGQRWGHREKCTRARTLGAHNLVQCQFLYHHLPFNHYFNAAAAPPQHRHQPQRSSHRFTEIAVFGCGWFCSLFNKYTLQRSIVHQPIFISFWCVLPQKLREKMLRMRVSR